MTVVGNATQLDVDRIVNIAIERYMTGAFVALAIGACTVLLMKAMPKGNLAIVMYFLISVSFFVISIGRPGSSYSYFLDAAISGSLAIGVLLLPGREDMRPLTTCVIAALLPSMLAGVPSGLAELVRFSYDDHDEHAQILQRLSRLNVKPGEYVLSDVIPTADVVEAGFSPVVNDSFQYTLLVRKRRLSAEPLMQLLRERRVPYAVLQNTLDWHKMVHDYWPSEVIDYLSQNYACIRELPPGAGYLVICALR